MNWFPQIGSGSLMQFPLNCTRRWRAIRNELESGEQILLPDSKAGQIEWSLSYQDLSDAEATSLLDLFSSCQGSYGTFGFLDPLANLLGWSQDLSRPDWQVGLLTASGGIDDPFGQSNAWSVTNSSPGDQQVAQSVAMPGQYVACFSVWVRSAAPGSVVLQRDAAQERVATGVAWKRVFVSGAGAAGGTSSAFSIGLTAGQSIQIFGAQVEAQPYPSQYKRADIAGGIYEETWFAADELTVTRTAPGLASCDIRLLSRP